MRRGVKKGLKAASISVLITFMFFSAAFGAVTLVGTVNEDYQIVADGGQIYEVAETEKGDEVVALIGKKVKVTGTIENDEGTKVMVVESYEVLQ